MKQYVLIEDATCYKEDGWSEEECSHLLDKISEVVEDLGSQFNALYRKVSKEELFDESEGDDAEELRPSDRPILSTKKVKVTEHICQSLHERLVASGMSLEEVIERALVIHLN